MAKSDVFRHFVSRINPHYVWYPHCTQLAAALQRVADGEVTRLMVFMPPRHGKSETVSRLFPSYYLTRYPDRFVGINSYSAELAYTLSRNARENYREAGGEFNSSAEAVKHWETARGGGAWAAGVGGSITGKGYHLGIIDDPLKNAEEAASATIRAKQKDWYLSTFLTRQEPGAAIIIIQTRWHEDDLSGWLLDEEGSESPEQWHIIRMEAIKEEHDLPVPESCTLEDDPRVPGAALCPERFSIDMLRHIRQREGSYYWNALYQQRPAPREGDFFKRHWFEIVDETPADAERVRWWDRAATASSDADYTAGALMSAKDGIYYIEDMERGQWSSAERDSVIVQTAQLDSPTVQQWTEQEPGSSGKDSARAFVKMLAGFAARARPSTGSKEIRADPFAAQAEAGNVKLKRGAWNRAYLEELAAFPNGKHDDQVDASSGAFNVLARTTGRRQATTRQG